MFTDVLKKKVLRPNDFIARVGGDEFVLIIQDFKSNLELTNILKRVSKKYSKPWLIQTNPYFSIKTIFLFHSNFLKRWTRYYLFNEKMPI